MIGSSSAITSPTRSGILNVESCSGIRPASMREMSRISLMIVSRWRPFDSMRPSCRLTGGSHSPGHALQQHRRVAEHRVERRPELVRHVREELRLERRRLLELDRLAPQQLVLLRDVGGGRLNLPLELVGGLLQLLVELRLLDRLAPIVKDRHDRGQLAVLRQHLAGDRLDRHRLAGLRIAQPDFADAALIGADQHAGDERRKMRVVGLHPALLDLAAPASEW